MTFTVTRGSDAGTGALNLYADVVGSGITAQGGAFGFVAGLTIAQGSDHTTFSVDVYGDTVVEANETVRVNISTSLGGAAVATGIGTIYGDDVGVIAPTFPVSLTLRSAVPVTSLLTFGGNYPGSPAVYRFWDGGTNASSGYFSTATNAHADAGANIDVAAADLGSVMVHAGSADGSETLWVQAYDGANWGAWQSFTLITYHPPPVVTLADHTVQSHASTALTNWLSVSDPEGLTPVSYRLYDSTDGADSGYFSTAAHAHEEALTIDVSAADIGSVMVHGGSSPSGGQDQLWVQAYNGYSWSAAALLTLTTQPNPNHPPSVTAVDHTVAAHSSTSVADWVTYAGDADGDAAVAYRFWDGGQSPFNGYFSTATQARVAQGTNVEVAAADLGTVQVHGGSSGGVQSLWVQAFDGLDWGPWTAFNLTTLAGANQAPTVTVSNHTVAVGSSVGIANWLTYADADGDAPVTYRFLSTGEWSGHLSTPSRSFVGPQINVDVAPSDLGSVTMHGGVTPGSQTFWVQAFDGTAWSAWTRFTLTTAASVVNSAPAVAVADHTVAINASSTVSSWLSTSDADGDGIVAYQFWDGGDDSGSAYFSTDAAGTGRQAAGAGFQVSAADLGNVRVHGGTAGGAETMWVQAFDGQAWGAWTSFTLTTAGPVNHAPTATIADQTVAAGSSTAVSGWLTYADADGDAAVKYKFWDGGTDSGSGYVSTAASDHAPAQTDVEVAAADLGSVRIHGGSAGGSETVWVQAYDGRAWGAWTSFTLTTTAPPVNHAPIVAVAAHTVTSSAGTAVAGWLAPADADGDAIVGYNFWEGATDTGAAWFSTDAAGAVKAVQGSNVYVSAANLGDVQVHGGSVSGDQAFWVQAYDGKAWGPWQSFTLTTALPVNHAPTVAVGPHTVTSSAGTAVAGWLTTTDSDGDAIVGYNFWEGDSDVSAAWFSTDPAGAVNAVKGSNVYVSAANLGNVQVHGGSVSGDQAFWVQAYDGQAWGPWQSFTLTTVLPVNHAPTVAVAAHTVTSSAGTVVAGWLTPADADGDAIVGYNFWEGTADASAAWFSTDAAGAVKAAQGSNVYVSAANLGDVQVHGGSVSGDQAFWVQAYDGKAWGPWQSFTLTTALPVNHAPTLTAQAHAVAVNASTAVSSWLTYADADADAVVTYRLWDGGQNGGYVSTAANAHAAAGVNIDVAAADIGGVSIHGGAAGGSQTLWLQAYDGKDWGAWTSFTLTTLPNHPPAAAIADQTLAAGATVNVGGLISYADADGDLATQYRFWDGGPASTSGYFSDSASPHEAAQANITVAAANLNSVVLHAGSAGGGSETMWVQAYDGQEWGAWSSFTLTTTAAANHAPAVTVSNHSLQVQEVAQVANWLSYSDADGDAAVTYRFQDQGYAVGSAYFGVGAHLYQAGGFDPDGTFIDVPAADLGNVVLNGGNSAQSETMRVQVYDGHDWSDWTSFTVTTVPRTNHLSLTQAPNQTVQVGATQALAGLTYTDADGDAAVSYRITDLGDISTGFFGAARSTDPYLSTSAVTHLASGAVTVISAADLSSLVVHGGSVAGGAEGFVIEAFDGKEWGHGTQFTVTSSAHPANRAPVITAHDQAMPAGEVPLLSLFSASDADNDNLYFVITDSLGTQLSSTVSPGHYAMFTGTAAQLQNETYLHASTTDQLDIRVWDGGAQGLGASAHANIALIV